MLIRVRHLIEGGCLFNFSQMVVRYDVFFCNKCMCQYLRSLIRTKKQRHKITLTMVGLLHKVGQAFGNKSTALLCHPFHYNSQCKVLERVVNHLLVIEFNQNYTSFVVLALIHKMRKWGHLFEGRSLFQILADRRGAYLKECLFEGKH